MPTVEQALACVRVCQMLSNSYRAIYGFRYDTNRKIVYIQAGIEVHTDEIEVEIAQSGRAEIHLMAKPNFKEMSRADLRTYVTEHRDDEEAWDAFFAKLEQERSLDTKWYPAPLDEESIRIGEEAIRQKIQEIENRRSPLNEN